VIRLHDTSQRWVEAIDGWTDWMVSAGRRQPTISLRRYQIRRFAEERLRQSPWKVTTGDLSEWLAGWDWSPATRESYRAALRGFYQWGVTVGRTRQDPAVRLPTVRVPRSEPRPAPETLLASVLAIASDRDRLVVMLGAYAGLRRAEIAGLRWVDMENTCLRIRGKGGHVRLVPTHPDLAHELDEEWSRRIYGKHGTGYRYMIDAGEEWVFPGQSGGHITPGGLGKAATRVLGTGWTAHTLRHRFATKSFAGTHDLLAVQTLLGHASPSTTQRYVQVHGDALMAAVTAAGPGA
jgi:integrase